MKATQRLHDLGQSIWLDNITRELPAVRPERTKRLSGTHKREVQRPVARVLNENSGLRPSSPRLNYVP